MCAQKPSPYAELWNPADLVDKYVFLVVRFLVIPHEPMLRLVMGVDPHSYCGNGKSGCVCARGAHEKTFTQSSFHPFAQTFEITQYLKHWRDDTYLVQSWTTT